MYKCAVNSLCFGMSYLFTCTGNAMMTPCLVDAEVQTIACTDKWFTMLAYQHPPPASDAVEHPRLVNLVGHLAGWFATGADSIDDSMRVAGALTPLRGGVKRGCSTMESGDTKCTICREVHQARDGVAWQVPDVLLCPICCDVDDHRKPSKSDPASKAPVRAMAAAASTASVQPSVGAAGSTSPPMVGPAAAAAKKKSGLFAKRQNRNEHVRRRASACPVYRSVVNAGRDNALALARCDACYDVFTSRQALQYHVEYAVCAQLKQAARTSFLSAVCCPLCATKLFPAGLPPSGEDSAVEPGAMQLTALVDQVLRRHCFASDAAPRAASADAAAHFTCPFIVEWVKLVGLPLHLTAMGRAYDHLQDRQSRDHDWLRLPRSYWVNDESGADSGERFAESLFDKLTAIAKTFAIEQATSSIRTALRSVDNEAAAVLTELFNQLTAVLPKHIEVDISAFAHRPYPLVESDCVVPPAPAPAPVLQACVCGREYSSEELSDHQTSCWTLCKERLMRTHRCPLCTELIPATDAMFREERERNAAEPIQQQLLQDEQVCTRMLRRVLRDHCYTADNRGGLQCSVLRQLDALMCNPLELHHMAWNTLRFAAAFFGSHKIHRLPDWQWYDTRFALDRTPTHRHVARVIENERRTRAIRTALSALRGEVLQMKQANPEMDRRSLQRIDEILADTAAIVTLLNSLMTIFPANNRLAVGKEGAPTFVIDAERWTDARRHLDAYE
jgi:hypothetical protein